MAERRFTREELLRGAFTHPREDCPRCGAHLLTNLVGVRWCSLLGCDYVAPAWAHPGPTSAPPSTGSCTHPVGWTERDGVEQCPLCGEQKAAAMNPNTLSRSH